MLEQMNIQSKMISWTLLAFQRSSSEDKMVVVTSGNTFVWNLNLKFKIKMYQFLSSKLNIHVCITYINWYITMRLSSWLKDCAFFSDIQTIYIFYPFVSKHCIYTSINSDHTLWKCIDFIGTLATVLVIQPCPFSRTEAPCLAMGHVFVSQDIFLHGGFPTMVTLTENLIKDLDLGYIHCVMQVSRIFSVYYLSQVGKIYLQHVIKVTKVHIFKRLHKISLAEYAYYLIIV